MTARPTDESFDKLIIETSPEFEKSLRILKKRYRNIGKDIGPVIENIEKGQLPGMQIPGTGFVVYKVRVQNRDINKGKSAGYRIIYQMESESRIALLAIYSKSDENAISVQLIEKTIAKMYKSSD